MQTLNKFSKHLILIAGMFLLVACFEGDDIYISNQGEAGVVYGAV